MKKLLIAVIALLGISAVSFAQTATPKDTTKGKAKVAAKKTTATAAKTTTAATAKPAAAATTATGTPVKKDGTPDKRFKVNKKDSATHVKKDGTPDKRFKENKKKQ